MQFKSHFRESICLIVSLILAICLLPNLGSAQESAQDTAKQEPASPGASNDTDNKDARPATPYALACWDTSMRRSGAPGRLAENREGNGCGPLHNPSPPFRGLANRMQ